jgi:hypothetical protein
MLDAPGATLTVEPYAKTGGHTLSFALDLPGTEWPDVVVAAIGLAQKVGSQWGLGGRISEQIDLLSAAISVGGVTMLTCTVMRAPS